MAREIIFTENAPKAVGPYVQAVRSNGMVYVSGQLGIDTAAGGLADGAEAQAHCSMKNLGAILRQAGTDYTKIVKTTILIRFMSLISGVIFRQDPVSRWPSCRLAVW